MLSPNALTQNESVNRNRSYKEAKKQWQSSYSTASDTALLPRNDHPCRPIFFENNLVACLIRHIALDGRRVVIVKHGSVAWQRMNGPVMDCRARFRIIGDDRCCGLAGFSVGNLSTVHAHPTHTHYSTHFCDSIPVAISNMTQVDSANVAVSKLSPNAVVFFQKGPRYHALRRRPSARPPPAHRQRKG